MNGRHLPTLLLAAVLAACGGADDSAGPAPQPSSPSVTATPTTPGSTPPTRPAATPTVTPTVTRAPTAADGLAAFFAAAASADAELRSAAELVNGDIGATTLRFRARTAEAVKALRVKQVSRTIPAGLDPELLRAALVVYGDLAGRAAALHRVRPMSEPVALTSAEGKDAIRCLGQGGKLAQRFAADLQQVRRLALASPPLRPVAATSRAGAEVAVRAVHIWVAHNGCDSCGGPAVGRLAALTWGDRAVWPVPESGWSHYGTVGDIPFRARWRAADGAWEAQINAC